LTQQLFESQVDTLVSASRVTPEQRRKALPSILRALFQADDRLAERILGDERMWAMIGLYDKHTSAGNRTAILRGARTPPIGVADMTQDERDRFLEIWRAGWLGPKLGGGDPSAVRFEVSKAGFTATPTLVLRLEMPGGTGGIPVFTPHALGVGLAKRISSLWSLDGDSADAPGNSGIAPSPAPEPQVLAPSGSLGLSEPWSSVLEGRLEDLAARTGRPILARLPEHHVTDPGVPTAGLLKDYQLKLNHPPLMVKWRSGTLLVSSQCWPDEELQRLPARILRQLRAAEARGGGTLPFDALYSAATALTPEQIAGLTRELPVMKHVRQWQPLLLVVQQSQGGESGLKSDDGLQLDDNLAAAFGSLPGNPFRDTLQDAVTMRVREKVSTDAGSPLRSIAFVIYSREGKFLFGIGFDFKGRARTTPVQLERASRPVSP